MLYQPEYPNLLFAQDGEVYDFNDKKAIVIGGAYSVDKYDRLASGLPSFPTEQPDDATKDRVERRLDCQTWYAGHYHVTCTMDRVQILFEDYDELE